MIDKKQNRPHFIRQRFRRFKNQGFKDFLSSESIKASSILNFPCRVKCFFSAFIYVYVLFIGLWSLVIWLNV
jgi:hypothetical protein